MMDSEFPVPLIDELLQMGEFRRVFELALPFAEAGHARAQACVASLHGAGLGVAANHAQEFAWYTKAVAQEDPLAWNNLGTLYQSGSPVVTPDEQKALDCYKRARELGFPRNNE